PRGVFVTLRNAGRLRGCIGTFNPQSPLPDTVWDMAAAAASDPRFIDRPLAAGELPSLHVEISVLSPLTLTKNPMSLEPGIHGIYIRSKTASGCFLPEVATEYGWSAEEFLSHCCSEKAGLPADSWRHPQTEVYLFTIEKISSRATDPGHG